MEDLRGIKYGSKSATEEGLIEWLNSEKVIALQGLSFKIISIVPLRDNWFTLFYSYYPMS